MFLRRALADIAAQTFTDWDVIVVNDGGDHPSVQEVVDRSGLAERVTLIDTAAPGGRCAAANAGVRAATGDYIVLHDDDDGWHPDFLLRTTEWLGGHPNDVGVMVSTEIVFEEQHDEGWSEVGRVPFWEGMTRISLIDLLEINRAVPISFLYRRHLHDLVGWYDESLETVEDWDFYLRIVARHPIGFLAGQPLAYWTQRPAASGADANSMYGLASLHARDDALVRDRALSAWADENGLGMPLYVALVEKRLRDEFSRELSAQLHQLRVDLVRDVYDRHPVWRRLRKFRARSADRRDADQP